MEAQGKPQQMDTNVSSAENTPSSESDPGSDHGESPNKQATPESEHQQVPTHEESSQRKARDIRYWCHKLSPPHYVVHDMIAKSCRWLGWKVCLMF